MNLRRSRLAIGDNDNSCAATRPRCGSRDASRDKGRYCPLVALTIVELLLSQAILLRKGDSGATRTLGDAHGARVSIA